MSAHAYESHIQIRGWRGKHKQKRRKHEQRKEERDRRLGKRQLNASSKETVFSNSRTLQYSRKEIGRTAVRGRGREEMENECSENTELTGEEARTSKHAA